MKQYVHCIIHSLAAMYLIIKKVSLVAACMTNNIVLFIHTTNSLSQVSAIEQDIIEVDPDTKEMLKVLVSVGFDTACSSHKG